MESLFTLTNGEEIEGARLADNLFESPAIPDQLRALKLALRLARLTPGNPLRPEDLARLLASLGEARREKAPRWIQCSQAELLRALDKDRSNKNYLQQLEENGDIHIRKMSQKVGYSSIEVRFRDPTKQATVWDSIRADRHR
jgi:hypothetical protein